MTLNAQSKKEQKPVPTGHMDQWKSYRRTRQEQPLAPAYDPAMATRSRLDSSLESEGAEFLVLGLLLCEGIQASKAYTKQPGYDLIAFEPERNRSCRIQVKSRWATDYDGSFLIKNFSCDFVVHVALNRGFRGYRKKATAEDDGRRPPVIYVFPVSIVQEAQGSAASWGKVFVQSIPDAASYIENWKLVRAFLDLTGEARRPRPGSAAEESAEAR